VEPVPLGLDEHCLSFVLCYPVLLNQADEAFGASQEQPLRPEDLTRPEDRAILTAWRQWLANNGLPDVLGDFYDTLDDTLQDRVRILVRIQEAQPPAPEDLLRNQVLDAITQLRLRNLHRQNHELRFLHEDAQFSGDRESLREYGRLNIELITRIGRLQRSIGERSISGRRQQEDATVRVPFVEG
jgi:hypothetical protein